MENIYENIGICSENIYTRRKKKNKTNLPSNVSIKNSIKNFVQWLTISDWLQIFCIVSAVDKINVSS